MSRVYCNIQFWSKLHFPCFASCVICTVCCSHKSDTNNIFYICKAINTNFLSTSPKHFLFGVLCILCVQIKNILIHGYQNLFTFLTTVITGKMTVGCSNGLLQNFHNLDSLHSSLLILSSVYDNLLLLCSLHFWCKNNNNSNKNHLGPLPECPAPLNCARQSWQVSKGKSFWFMFWDFLEWLSSETNCTWELFFSLPLSA